jgi:ABC-type antimicrobial peptide transport system permease subunit
VHARRRPIPIRSAIVVLSAIGLLACLGPALKAAVVNPIEALRRD